MLHFLDSGVKVYENTNSNFVWLKLNSSFFNLEKDLFVCFLHIPPENVTYIVLLPKEL
jgi:hypothetical protein